MDLKIIEEKTNPLFNRKEFQFKVQAKIVPSRAEIGKLISEKFSAPLENIEIKKISGKFGSNYFDIITFIYKSKEDRMSTENNPKIIAEEKIEEKPKEEIQKNKESEKTSETEEVKEEVKVEDKTDAAGVDKNEDNNKINENVDNELTDKDNSERNESEAN